MQPERLYLLIDRRQRRKQAAVQSLRRRLSRLGLGLAAFVLLFLFSLLFLIGLAYASLVDGLPSLAQLPALFNPEHGALLQPTRIYDRSGQQLLLSLENPGISRRFLAMDANQPDHFSPELIRATIGYVEPNFWRSSGFSLVNLTSSQPATIAERLVDDLLLWNEPRGLRRALRMRVLAAQVIARYGHVQVLEWYLNSAYYGHLAFGADSAARLYLGKPATSLDLPEAALLIAANQAPALNPVDASSAALERQQAVLQRLLERGVVTGAEYTHAVVEKVRLAPPLGQDATPAAAFSRLVLSGLEERFGPERLERGGLKVITTLDYSLQQELACLVRVQLARLEGLPDDVHLPDGSACVAARLLPTLPPGDAPLPASLASSAVILDPQTGQVLALLGDTTSAGESNFLASRPPGSLLSPFIAVAGFARGFSPASLTWDIPASLPVDLSAQSNPDGKFHGPVRLRTAIANDYLAPQAQILAQIGASSVWRLASTMGVSSMADETSAGLLYQGGKVSPLEMAQAYSVFASQGQRAGQRLVPGGDIRPAMVLYVEDLNGTTWLDARAPDTQAVTSPQLAYLVHNVLSDATARQVSLGYANPLEIGRPSAAKIGQVEDGLQAWTAGYTPQRVAIFSLNLAGDKTRRLNPRTVAGMWHAFMQYANRSLPVTDWPVPAGISRVNVCDPSGQLPTQACPEIVNEVFLTGNTPNAPDSLFRAFQINRETGRLATVFTPAALIEEKIFLVPPPQARDWAQAANLPVPPEDYDAIQPPEPSTNVRITSPELFGYVRGQVKIKGTAVGDGLRTYQVLVGQGLNPENWLQVGQTGSAPVSNGDLATWDTQGQEGLYAIRLQVIRQDQTVETATIQVTVDNTPPLVRIPYPINDQGFQLPQDRTITFQADASDAIGVVRLVWLVDGVKAGESQQAPFALTWQAVRGDHTLQVLGYDAAGNEGKSEQVHFSVK